MGFSVAPKELQCLNPAVILPFKLTVAVSLPSQPSGNPSRQAMLAVMRNEGRFWQRDLQVHMLAHRLRVPPAEVVAGQKQHQSSDEIKDF